MMGEKIYTHMRIDDHPMTVDRAVALHKMIRLITLATAGAGYMNFMGNEFGHPEWIDFPREGNNWSYAFARRQWSLLDHPDLKYRLLGAFDQEIIRICKTDRLFQEPFPFLLHEHTGDKVIAFSRRGLIFVFNFHPTTSYSDYKINAPLGEYLMILYSDDKAFGGHDLLMPHQRHFTLPRSNEEGGRSSYLSLYLPARSAIVLKPV